MTNPLNFKKKVAISCILTLSLNALPVQTFASQVSKNKDFNTTMLDKSNDSYEFNFKDLNIKVKQTENFIIATSYKDDSFLSKTTRNIETGDMETEFKDGRIEKNNVSEFINEKINTSHSIETKFKDDTIYKSSRSDMQKASSGYDYIKKDYNSGIKQWGYLYGKDSIKYGETYNLSCGAGTAVSMIVGAIGGLVTGGTVMVAILSALGTTVASESITAAISGKVYGRFTNWKYEVYSQSKLGLKTEQTIVDAKVINSKNGNQKWIHLRTEDDTRSLSDLCKAGAYNVYLNTL